jgi:hypothetical protein
MEHVTPGYILGQKKRLEAEHRYSGGLLLNVVKCRDDLPEKYVVGEDSDPPQPPLKGGEKIAPRSPLKGGEKNPPERRRSPLPHPLIRGEQNPPQPPLQRGVKKRGQLLEDEMEMEEDAGLEIEPDPSIYEPLSAGGMTAARAWPAVLRELQSDMPKSTYDRWVRDTVLLSARDGIFLIGAHSGYTRDWLESRLTSTIARLLVGICNRSMKVRFVDIAVAAPR